MEKKYYWKKDSDRKLATELLLAENIIAGSSDTVPGLFALPSAATFEKLNSIKGRQNKPYLLLAQSIDEVKKLTDMFSERNNPTLVAQIESLMDHYWPGPLTLILPKKKDLPPFFSGDTPNIAVRVPSHPHLQKLLADIPFLFSTSANKAGQPLPLSVSTIDPEIKGQVALIIDDEKGEITAKPSTIVDCTGTTLVVVREGAIPAQDILT